MILIRRIPLFLFCALVGMGLLISSCKKDDDTSCTESTWYADADEDGLGDSTTTQSACEQPQGYVANSNDTDDTVACTEVTWYADADGDGLGDATTTQSACEQPQDYVANSNDIDDTIAGWYFEPAADNEEKVQEALILAENGATIEFSAGTFEFTNTLSLEGKNSITIRGAGRDETTLSFANQTAGAEGLDVSNCDWFLIRDLTIADAIGDNVKVKDGDGISFVNMGAVYTGPVSGNNGAYALYPVACKNVYVDNCYVRGASDAGIYVGQSEKIVVRNNLVEENVAGIEIENSIEADVYNNEARHNTGGVLVFDLPNLPVIVNGRQCRIYNNNIHHNDHKNFALSGTVRQIPPGTGIMLLASAEVEVYDNQIINNNIMGIGVISMKTLDVIGGSSSNTDNGYDPYVYDIHIHDNTFQRTTDYPAEPNDVGVLLQDQFPDGDMRDILYDGFVAPSLHGDATEGICIHDNTGATFVDINVPTFFANHRYDASPHDCVQTSLPAAVISAPAYE